MVRAPIESPHREYAVALASDFGNSIPLPFCVKDSTSFSGAPNLAGHSSSRIILPDQANGILFLMTARHMLLEIRDDKKTVA